MSDTKSVSSVLVLSLVVVAVLAITSGVYYAFWGKGASTTAPSSLVATAQPLSEAAQTLLTAIKHIAKGEAEAAAAYVSYPLTRPAPLASIQNADEFVRAFPALFTDQVRARLTESLQRGEVPELIGWRGYAFLQGVIWGIEDSGKIYVLNALSDAESALVEQVSPEQKGSWITPE